MPSLAPTRVTIDVDPKADPIAGVVHAGAGQGQEFAGWMALIRAIEVAVDTARHARPPGAAPPRGGATRQEIPQ